MSSSKSIQSGNNIQHPIDLDEEDVEMKDETPSQSIPIDCQSDLIMSSTQSFLTPL